MRLVTFLPPDESRPRLGLVWDSPTPTQLGPAQLGEHWLLDAAAAAAACLTSGTAEPLRDMQTLLERGDAGWRLLNDLRALAEEAPDSCHHFAWPLRDCRLLAPLPLPRSLRDCLSYERHWVQAARAIVSRRLPGAGRVDRLWQRLTGRSLTGPPAVWRRRPVYYKGNPHSVVGPDAEVRWPACSRQLDFELEVAVYIGRQGRDIAVEQALNHVAGYSLFNDFTARDIQLEELRARMGPAKSKDFDTGNSLGPWLLATPCLPDDASRAATAATHEAIRSLDVQVLVNGQPWARSSTESLRHGVAETVAFISQDETLRPGDVIGLGTVPDGCGLELDRWLTPGDEVELRAGPLGTLRNRVTRDGA